MSPLKKTSICIDPEQIELLAEIYPELPISEVIRMALWYLIETKPILIKSKSHFKDSRAEEGK
jgi:hypothetical protein